MFDLLNNKKGITLISLVIIIILLLILAGIIMKISSNYNLIHSAQKSVDDTKLGQIREQILFWQMENKLALTTHQKPKTLENFLKELVDKKLLTEDQSQAILNDPNNEIKLFEETISFKTDANSTEALGTIENPYNYSDLIGSAVQTEYTIKVNNLTLQVGDYVEYTPLGTTYAQTDMDNYSGNTDNNDLQPEKLQWRVYDVKEGKIRLISWNGTYIGTKNGRIKLGYGTEDEGNNEARWNRQCYGV